MRPLPTLALLSALLTVPALPAAHAGGGCHEEAPLRPTAATTIAVDGICFGPHVAAAPVGSTVTWVNRSGMEHNVTGPAVPYQELPNGASVTMTFDRPGIHVYACTFHPGMSGAVVVGPAALTAAPAPAAPVAPTSLAAAPVASTSGSGGVPSAAALAVAALVTLGAAALVLVRRRGTARVVAHSRG